MTPETIEGEAIEVIEPQRAVVVAQPGQAIISADTPDGPERMLERATGIATALAKMVEKQKLYTVISGKKFPQVEAWMTIGRMDNVVAREVAGGILPLEDGAFEAHVELVRLSDGMVIGRASAMCGVKGDKPWDSRPTHQRRSMAVTRATSRAFRQQYSWIMALAGYEPTPADEMPQEERRDSFADSAYGHDEPEPDRERDGYTGTVSRGKSPVDMELRQTPDGAAWGFKLTEGRKARQALAIGPLAGALSMQDIAVGTEVTVWGPVEMIPWDKDGKKMPPYARIRVERVRTPDWTLPTTAIEAESEPLFSEEEQAKIDAATEAVVAA